MKRILAILMISMMVFALVACQGADESDGDSNGDTTNQEEPYDSTDDDGDTNGMNGNGADDGTDSGDVPDDSNDTDEEPSKPLDAQIEDTMEIEGMEEPITLNIYQDETAPFRTYIPYNFLAEKTSGEEGEVCVFFANYSDVRLEDLYLKLYFFSEDIGEEQVASDPDNSFSVTLAQMEPVEANERIYSWSAKEFMSSGEPKYAMVGMHEGQYFVMFISYYGEYTEGFIPRMNKIIEHFYWTDTQEYLAQ